MGTPKSRTRKAKTAPKSRRQKPKDPPVSGLATTRQVSDFFNVSRKTIHRLRESGQLPYYRIGRQYRYDLMSVKSALAKFT